jgi:RNA polymerase sigma-70 factor (ECF subfamily)
MTSEFGDTSEPLPESDIERLRAEIIAFLYRLVTQPQLAEDLAQEAFARALASSETAPTQASQYRAWLFSIATNLGLDSLRKAKRHGEVSMFSLREAAEGDPDFMERSKQLIGTPETALVASEHLMACFSCTLQNLPERKAAALLLREVHDFSLCDIATILGIETTQAKNAIQDARRIMKAKYDTTCALITKQGICYQCAELADFFKGAAIGLDHTGDAWDARMRIVKDFSKRRPSVWHKLMLNRFLPHNADE